ncbi:MAG: hypothetical protein WCO63_16385 [Bacteroidota bacterium]
MTNKIKTWLIQDRAFETGVQLFHAYGNRKSFSSTLNRQGYSPYNHALLIEELRKTAGISAVEIEDILSRPPQVPKVKKAEKKCRLPAGSEEAAVVEADQESCLEDVPQGEQLVPEAESLLESMESLEDKKKDNLIPSKKESKSEKSSPS